MDCINPLLMSHIGIIFLLVSSHTTAVQVSESLPFNSCVDDPGISPTPDTNGVNGTISTFQIFRAYNLSSPPGAPILIELSKLTVFPSCRAAGCILKLSPVLGALQNTDNLNICLTKKWGDQWYVFPWLHGPVFHDDDPDQVLLSYQVHRECYYGRTMFCFEGLFTYDLPSRNLGSTTVTLDPSTMTSLACKSETTDEVRNLGSSMITSLAGKSETTLEDSVHDVSPTRRPPVGQFEWLGIGVE